MAETPPKRQIKRFQDLHDIVDPVEGYANGVTYVLSYESAGQRFVLAPGGGGPGGGVTDHGNLTGLGDNDHPQYVLVTAFNAHNHDAQYAAINHLHTGVYAPVVHTHDDRYYTETEVNNRLPTVVVDAVGDGVAYDDAQIAAAFAAAPTGGVVRFPPGKTYRIRGPILVTKSLIIQGYGATLKPDLLKQDGSANPYAIHFQGTSGARLSRVAAFGLSVDASSKVGEPGLGFGVIRFDYCDRVVVRDVYSNGGHNFVDLSRCSMIDIDGVTAENNSEAVVTLFVGCSKATIRNVEGWLVDEIVDVFDADDLLIEGIVGTSTGTQQAIDLSSSRNVTVRGVDASGFGGVVLVKFENGGLGGAWNNIRLYDIHGRGFTAAAGVSVQASGSTGNNFVLDKFHLQSTTAGLQGVLLSVAGSNFVVRNGYVETAGIGIQSGVAHDVTIENNRVVSSGGRGIYLVSGLDPQRARVRGNTVTAGGGTGIDVLGQLDPVIERNHVLSATSDGVNVSQCARPIVDDNRVDTCGGHGVSVQYTNATYLDSTNFIVGAYLRRNRVRNHGTATTFRGGVRLAVTTVTGTYTLFEVSGNSVGRDEAVVANSQYGIIVSRGSLTGMDSGKIDNNITSRIANGNLIDVGTAPYTTQLNNSLVGRPPFWTATGAGVLQWSDNALAGSADTNLYRSAANELTTDDSLIVALNLTVNGNATLGNADTDVVTATGRLVHRAVANTSAAGQAREIAWSTADSAFAFHNGVGWTLFGSGGGGGATSLDGLTDVVIDTPADGEVLWRTGGVFVNATLAEAGIASSDHNHNGTYSLVGHDHDADYADINHSHSRTGGTLTGFGSAAGLDAGAAAGNVPVLDGSGKLASSTIPSLALSEFLGTVASEAVMLATTGQRGDYVIRTDTDPDTFWIQTADDGSQLANWHRIDALQSVVSVNGQVGTVALTTADIAESGNLYFTSERVDDRVATLLQNADGLSWTYDDGGGTLTPSITGYAELSANNLFSGANTFAENTIFIGNQYFDLMDGADVFHVRNGATEVDVFSVDMTGVCTSIAFAGGGANITGLQIGNVVGLDAILDDIAADLADRLSMTTVRVANTVLAGPATGADAAPTFRALVLADVPATALGTGTANATSVLRGDRTWGRARPVAATALTVTTNAVTPNADDNERFTVSHNANLTINNPTGTPVDEQVMSIRIKNTGASPITVTLGANFRFNTDITAITNIAAGVTNRLSFRWHATDSRWDLVAESRGN